jgi:hypothetical protein
MKNIKTFDLFQKIASDTINQPTFIGSILSFISISLIIHLLFKELIAFFTPVVLKDTIVMNEQTHFPEREGDQIMLNFSIMFPHTPCSLLSLDREELIGTHIANIEHGVIKDSYDRLNNRISSYYPYKTTLLENSLHNQEKCDIHGYVNMTKSPGDIHFSFHPYTDLYDRFIKPKEDLINKIRLSHSIKALSFGGLSDSQLQHIKHRFGQSTYNILEQGYHKQFIDHIDIQSYNYEYYLVLVPYLLIDEIEGLKYLTYVYSVSQTKRLNNNTAEMPMLMMNYEISNIGMTYTLKDKSMLHSITHICAIVGGVFVIFSLINRIALGFSDYYHSTNTKLN